MENNGTVRIFGQDIRPVPRLEEEIDVNSVVSGSISNSSSRTIPDLVVRAHPDSDSDGNSAKSEVSAVELDSFAGGQLVRVREIDEPDQFVKSRFLSIISGLGRETTVETVYKNVYSGFTWQAKLKSFLEISRNMGGGKYAWFGGSKDEINNIFRYGFASRGRGICLSPFNSPIASLRGCVADENGLYHLILCRAILGKSELLSQSAQQKFPSSEEFHSAVDNLASPRVYMVWSSLMNTHVLPQYVVSFRPPVNVTEGAASIRSPVKAKGGVASAKEELAKSRASGEPARMVPFHKLLLELALVLPTDTIRSLQKVFREYHDGKVTKPDMTRRLRQLAGDDLLYRTILSMRRRQGASEEAAPGDSNNVVSAQRKSGARSRANRVVKNLRGARRTA